MRIYVKDVEKGVRVRPESRSLRRFSQAWLDCMSRYEKRVPGDWPFWYGERPLIGFLTAATWASGSVCIEEYLTEKKADAAERAGPDHADEQVDSVLHHRLDLRQRSALLRGLHLRESFPDELSRARAGVRLPA